MFLLLGGDYGLDPASLEAFPQQHYGCDGRANLLCAPIEPFLLRRLPTGGITLLVNPRRACAARVTVVGSVCVCVCVSVKSHLTYGASVRPENAVTYSAGNEG